ncbi:MAG TPA: uroporphyrinogen decarboxylase family protein [Acidobacteriota bacterium]|nr:uroporphyrinogen decarboxylase family protein [Acidobacteriota bacterium]
MRQDWAQLTRDQKREERMKDWLVGTGIHFRNSNAENLYKERATRFKKAMMCEIPDRVPVQMPSANFPVYYAGYTLKRVMNDYAAMEQAWLKFMEDFGDDMDTFMGPGGWVFSAPAMEIIDYKALKWPGHGLGDDVNTFQFVEEAIMKADEYDALMKDPSDFSFRFLIPRVVGTLKPLGNFPPLNSLMFLFLMIAYPFADPNMRAAFQSLIRAGEEMEKWQKHVAAVDKASKESGFPAFFGALAIAPFDVIADFMRGTKGVILDMYRCPEKLLEAIDRVTELTIDRILSNLNATGGFAVTFPLHKGDDTFMSRKQFERFYWPSLKKVMDTLIEEGISIRLAAEGRYNQRLDYIKDFPKGWVTWHFDQTDMVNAKKIVGGTCCISGNVPASTVITGTAKEVKECCRRLIETCAPGGGYILAAGASGTEANAENLRAFMEAAREYGVYK